MGLFRNVISSKKGLSSLEKQCQRQDGRLVWTRLHLSPLKGGGGECQYFIGMVEDISDRKQAEEEIRTYQEQLRSLSSELSLTEERERRRLATELHDHVGQILALAQIKLGALRESASSTNLTSPMDEIRRLIEQTIQYTRSLTFELSPPILYDLGFEAAVEWLAELIQTQHGLRIEVHLDANPKPMNDELKVLLFQAVRELLVNVVKHAKATRVAVYLSREGEDLFIKVIDDGVGLQLPASGAAPRPGGFGLFSIKERLKYLGGHLEMESQPGQGTQVTLVVPLKY